jgi:hypothetical protein
MDSSCLGLGGAGAGAGDGDGDSTLVVVEAGVIFILFPCSGAPTRPSFRPCLGSSVPPRCNESDCGEFDGCGELLAGDSEGDEADDASLANLLLRI